MTALMTLISKPLIMTHRRAVYLNPLYLFYCSLLSSENEKRTRGNQISQCWKPTYSEENPGLQLKRFLDYK